MKIKTGIIGTGNIGTDLLIKIKKRSTLLEVAMFAGIDAQSDGIARAKKMGVSTSAEGIESVLKDPLIKIVFDATSAKAHLRHAPLLKEHGVFAVDLTPAAVGPYVVPAVGIKSGIMEKQNINLVTCGGQSVIPMVYAVSRVAKVSYAETVTTIASRSAGPGTRANIDEFTQTTAKGVQIVGQAKKSKSIIILNPADPPVLNRSTIYTVLEENADAESIRDSIADMVTTVQQYVPGYRLKHDPVFEGDRVIIMVEVEGAGDFLPRYAGNLDIMTSTAIAAGEAAANYMLKEQ